MRRLFFALLIMMMTMVTANAQTLTERQKGLAACACLMAQGEEQATSGVRLLVTNSTMLSQNNT